MAAEAPSPAAARVVVTERRYLSRQTRRTIAFYTFIAPWLAGFLLLGLGPMLIGFLASLTNYNGVNLDTLQFVGLRNYERIFTADRDLGLAVSRTILWTMLNVPIWLVASFILALILDQAVRARGFFRTVFYLPSILPIVAIVWAWRVMLGQNNGLLNGILSITRGAPVAEIWLGGNNAIYSLTVISVWAGLGSGMIIFLAGLQGIPESLKEAARIDGAGAWRVIRHVTMPLMTPVIFFQLILSIIGSLQQFTIPMILAGGQLGSRPPDSTYLYMIHVNLQTFASQRFGYGMALIWVMFVVIILLTVIVFWTARYWVYYEADIK